MITSIRSLANERMRRREARIRQLEQERDVRERAIFQRVPRLAEIKSLQAAIGLDLARLVLRAPTQFHMSFEELQDWSLRLSAERERLLSENQIDPRDLEVAWDCPRCQNTGWLKPEQASADTVYPPQKCLCLIQEEIDDLFKAAGLTGPLRQQTFERWDASVYPPGDRSYMQKVCDYCKRFAERVAAGERPDSLLLFGDVGLGKTFLASAIGNAVVSARRTVVYFTLSEFMDLTRLRKFEDEELYREGLQLLLDADLIILDDLGAEKVTDFVGQELFNLINHRINRQLPMVVSTNLTPPEIEESYGQRMYSRLVHGFETFQLRGQDVRRVLRRRKDAL